MRLGYSIWIFLLVALQIFVPSTPAFATNFGATSASSCGYTQGNSGPSPATNCVSKANNATHAVRYSTLGNQWTGIDAATTGRISSVYNPISGFTAYVTTTDPVPDVWVYDLYYGTTGIIAWVDCPASNSGVGGSGTSRWCRGQILRYNATYQNYAVGSQIACHELGHTIGLRHRTTTGSCMYTYGDILAANTLDSHDISHVEAGY